MTILHKNFLQISLLTMGLILGLFSPQESFASRIKSPAHEVLLTVTGQIKQTPSQNSKERPTLNFDRRQLESFPAHTLVTTTPWTQGRVTFKGVLFKDLLKHVGASGNTIKATAWNDFQIDIPASDMEKYNVLIAYEQDGKILKRRDKGPLWIIYPSDQYPELKNVGVYAKYVWQLRKIHIY